MVKRGVFSKCGRPNIVDDACVFIGGLLWGNAALGSDQVDGVATYRTAET